MKFSKLENVHTVGSMVDVTYNNQLMHMHIVLTVSLELLPSIICIFFDVSSLILESCSFRFSTVAFFFVQLFRITLYVSSAKAKTKHPQHFTQNQKSEFISSQRRYAVGAFKWVIFPQIGILRAVTGSTQVLFYLRI